MSQLSTLYTQPHRTYHNINHINECLVELENIPSELLKVREYHYHDHTLIETAIWYHDAVYNPYSKRNEIESAALLPPIPFSNKMSLPELVRDIILATAKHIITQDKLSFAAQVMLDIDLAGFGQETQICLQNGENVRKEYYKTPELDFQKGRLNFIQTISKRESLYYTDYFKEKYHVQSQKNLKIEEEMALEYVDYWPRQLAKIDQQIAARIAKGEEAK